VSGESDLQVLLASMRPELLAERCVFLSIAGKHYGHGAELEPIAMCMEREGLTLIAPLERAAAAGHRCDDVYRQISLSVHSSLNAVGLTAAISAALASHNISANVVAGFYHDHLFVPEQDADRALAILKELSG